VRARDLRGRGGCLGGQDGDVALEQKQVQQEQLGWVEQLEAQKQERQKTDP